MLFAAYYLTLIAGQSIVMSHSVCMCICMCCLSEHIAGTSGLNLSNFLCMLPVVIVLSSSGCIAICYVVPAGTKLRESFVQRALGA